jgi:hypothetical protein
MLYLRVSKFAALILNQSPIRLRESTFSLIELVINRKMQICNNMLPVQIYRYQFDVEMILSARLKRRLHR